MPRTKHRCHWFMSRDWKNWKYLRWNIILATLYEALCPTVPCRQPINYVEFWTLGLVQLVTLFNVWNWHIKPCMQKHYLQHYLPDYSIMRSSRYKASTARWIATRSPLVITSHRQRAFGTCAIMCWTRNIIVRSEEHTSELQSHVRTSYAVFCLKKKIHKSWTTSILYHIQRFF